MLLAADGVLRPNHVLAVLASQPGKRAAAPPARAPEPQLEDMGAGVVASADLPPLREARERFDRLYLEEAMRRSGGNVSAAARLAGRNRTDFHALLRRHSLSADHFREDD